MRNAGRAGETLVFRSASTRTAAIVVERLVQWVVSEAPAGHEPVPPSPTPW